MTRDDNQINRAQIRESICNHLQSEGKSQFEEICQTAFQEAVGRHANRNERMNVLEILHDLFRSGVLIPAADPDNAGWPWIGTTPAGREMLSSEGPPVYDPDRYMSKLQEAVTDLDDTVKEYLAESLRAYHQYLLRASVVMLGGASERLIQVVAKAWFRDLGWGQEALHRLSRKPIGTLFTNWQTSVQKNRERIDDARLRESVGTEIEQVFQFVRMARNDAGHPASLRELRREEVYAFIQAFYQYAIDLEALHNALEKAD